MDSQGFVPGVCSTPVTRAAMVQWWDELTFLHWPYSAAEVQALLPPQLEVETCDGSAWVGLVPFFLRVGVPRSRPVPWVSQFAETNVRTYVRTRDGESGIWFFSLDAARLGAVLVARATYQLPYFWSRMRLERTATSIRYECQRRWPGPPGPRSSVRIEVGDSYAPEALTELDHFLTARWALFSAPRSGLHRARAFHAPWPLHRAEVASLQDELVRAAGLSTPNHKPLVHYSPSVEVRIGWPHRASRARAIALLLRPAHPRLRHDRDADR
jgi:uncharacterized protein YqjF (DUF2071 family)